MGLFEILLCQRRSKNTTVTPVIINARMNWIGAFSRKPGEIVLVTVVQYEVRVNMVVAEEVTVRSVVQIDVAVVRVVQVIQLLT